MGLIDTVCLWAGYVVCGIGALTAVVVVSWGLIEIAVKRLGYHKMLVDAVIRIVEERGGRTR